MISRELALALRTAGVRWKPSTGDRFTLLDPAFVGDVFTLAEMTVEPQGPPDAPVRFSRDGRPMLSENCFL